MDVNMFLFLGGIFFTVLSPFLGVYAYMNGNDGPTCFAVIMIGVCLGVGLLAGFAH